jgi:hypothetical protein
VSHASKTWKDGETPDYATKTRRHEAALGAFIVSRFSLRISRNAAERATREGTQQTRNFNHTGLILQRFLPLRVLVS